MASMKVRAGISAFPWLCWFTGALIYLFQYGLFAMLAAFKSEVEQELQLSATELGFLTSAFLYSYVFMQIPAGILLDRFGARRTLLCGLVVILLGLLCMTLAPNLLLALIGRALIGLGGGSAFVCAIYLGRTWLPIAIFPLILGITEAMSSLGEFGFMAISALLIRIESWRFILAEFFLAGLFLLFLTHQYIRDKKHYLYSQRQPKSGQYLGVLKDPRLWLISLCVGGNFVHIMALASFWNVPFLMIKDHLTNLEAVVLNSLIFIGFMIGCPLIGVLSDRFPPKKIILVTSLLEIVFLSITSLTSSDLAIEGILFLLLGICTGHVLLAFSLIRDFIPIQAYGFASGFVNLYFGVAGLICLPLIGYVFEYSQENPFIAVLPVLLINALAILAFLLYSYIDHKRRNEHDRDLSKSSDTPPAI